MLNPQLLRLIHDCSIEQLKSSLESMFRTYLLSNGDGVYPLDYDKVIANYYHLVDFLNKLESIDLD